jgi:hypothetical protein
VAAKRSVASAAVFKHSRAFALKSSLDGIPGLRTTKLPRLLIAHPNQRTFQACSHVAKCHRRAGVLISLPSLLPEPLFPVRPNINSIAALHRRSEPRHLNVIGIARHVDQEGRAIYLKSINDNSTRALCSRINALRQAFSMRGRQVSQSFTFSS